MYLRKQYDSQGSGIRQGTNYYCQIVVETLLTGSKYFHLTFYFILMTLPKKNKKGTKLVNVRRNKYMYRYIICSAKIYYT